MVFPGNGTQRIQKDGTLITDYPKLIINQKDHLAQANKVILNIELSDPNTKVKFYRGSLTEGKYLNDDLFELATQNGITQIDFNVTPGSVRLIKR